MSIDLKRILSILPQQYPFRFIDRVSSFDPKERKITCLKNFSMNEYFFPGHFPNNPVVPGAIMIEAMAQAAILLYGALKPDIAAQKPDFFLGRVEAKFKKPVYPGDMLAITVTASKILDSSGIVEAEAMVKDDVCAQTTIAFGIRTKT